ncbi:hypothetical protein UB32_03850 [Mesobacillus subterraneus]|uniref:Uncharacterized protein n=1 Tax=Mesobacillus subterraneus TaxID=285983 RepID=A0A0D6ZDA4_9BACI|nr:hypothetical protein UB32_03850 [Mesobacillus subterraneus]
MTKIILIRELTRVFPHEDVLIEGKCLHKGIFPHERCPYRVRTACIRVSFRMKDALMVILVKKHELLDLFKDK